MKYIEIGLSLICHVCFIYFATLSLYLGKRNSLNFKKKFISVQSLSLVLHRLQQARLPCPSPTPRACSNTCPSNQWCHHPLSSPFSSCLQSFATSGFFPMTQFFASGSQNTGTSASASILLMNIQDLFPSGLNGLTFLQFKGLSRVFSNTTVQKHQFFGTQLSL